VGSASTNAGRSIRIVNPSTGVAADSRLQLVSDTVTFDIIASSSNYTNVASWVDAGILSTDANASGGLVLNAQAGGIKFQTGTTEAMRINSSRQVSIGSSFVSGVATRVLTVDDASNAAIVIAHNGATALNLYADGDEANIGSYLAGANMKFSTTPSGGSTTERMRITNAGELNIGGYGGQFPILKVVGLAGGVHTGSTWSISANQDGIGRTILATGGQGRAMYFENDGKTVHTQESYFDKGVYLGGSVAANLLDDYEEGTFYATTNNDGVGTQVTANYRKIGQLVTYTVYIPNWSPTFAGTAVIAGFPFTAIITNGYGVGNVTHSTAVLNCSGGYHETTNWNGTLNNSTGRSSWVVASARSIMVTGFYYTTS
jgi:hypothetical protein